MYEAYWGLSEPAFGLTPDPRFFFLGRGHESALMMLHYAILYDKGAAMLCGEVGVGKTTASRKLVEWLNPKRYALGFVENPLLTPLQMLQQAAVSVGVETPARDRRRLYEQLSGTLRARADAGVRTVLLFDEAHLLRKGTLEELRLLLNIVHGDKFLLNLVLLGQPELLSNVEHVGALSQRISVRALLHSLDVQEMSDLITHRLEVAGLAGAKSPFTPDALFELHRYSGGTPRLICQAADALLLAGCLQRVKRIDGFFAHSALLGQNLWSEAA